MNSSVQLYTSRLKVELPNQVIAAVTKLGVSRVDAEKNLPVQLLRQVQLYAVCPFRLVSPLICSFRFYSLHRTLPSRAKCSRRHSTLPTMPV